MSGDRLHASPSVRMSADQHMSFEGRGKGVPYEGDPTKGAGKGQGMDMIDLGKPTFNGKGCPWRRPGDTMDIGIDSEDWLKGLYDKNGDWFPFSAWRDYWVNDVHYADWVCHQAKAAREQAEVTKDVAELQETLLKIRTAWKKVGQGDH